jgi:hypothetical protein
MVQFDSEFVDFFARNDLLIDESGVLKAPTVIISRPICTFISSRVCLMKLSAPMFDAYKFTIINYC